MPEINILPHENVIVDNISELDNDKEKKGDENEISNNCITCDNDNKSLYLVEDLKNCEFSNFSGYYLDIESLTLKKCGNSL